MKKTAVIIVLLFSMVSFSAAKNLMIHPKNDGIELIEELTTIAKSLLEGTNLEEIKSNISHEAFLISNNNSESIWEILGNPSKRENFIDGKEVEIITVNIRRPDEGKCAYMTLQTKSEDNDKVNWHTIFL